MADADFRHNGDGHRIHDALDQLDAAHARNATGGANIGGNALERHDGDGAGFLRDCGVFGGHDIHDDATLEHLREPALNGYRSFFHTSILTAETTPKVVARPSTGVLRQARPST